MVDEADEEGLCSLRWRLVGGGASGEAVGVGAEGPGRRRVSAEADRGGRPGGDGRVGFRRGNPGASGMGDRRRATAGTSGKPGAGSRGITKGQESVMMDRVPEVPEVESVVVMTEEEGVGKWRDSTGGRRGGTVEIRTGMLRAARGRGIGTVRGSRAPEEVVKVVGAGGAMWVPSSESEEEMLESLEASDKVVVRVRVAGGPTVAP